MSKAGDPIQRFSESTHIGALNKACKMMKIKKKLNSFSSNDHYLLEFYAVNYREIAELESVKVEDERHTAQLNKMVETLEGTLESYK